MCKVDSFVADGFQEDPGPEGFRDSEDSLARAVSDFAETWPFHDFNNCEERPERSCDVCCKRTCAKSSATWRGVEAERPVGAASSSEQPGLLRFAFFPARLGAASRTTCHASGFS